LNLLQRGLTERGINRLQRGDHIQPAVHRIVVVIIER
jgi:hypothetical protein